MTKVTVDMLNDGTPDFVMLIPNEIVGDGEAGEPLTPAIIALIKSCASFGWAPLDFGECHKECTELWFYRSESPEEARLSAKHFIDAGGYV